MKGLILKKLKVLLSAYPSVTFDDDYLMMVVERELSNATSYCNREEMPVETASTIAFMCLDSILDSTEKSVKSVSEGGASVSFGNMTSEQLKAEYKKALDRYKQARAI